MENYRNESEYLNDLTARGGLPRGFRVSSSSFSFFPEEVHSEAKMNVNLILLDKPTSSFAGIFTRNAFPGAPVILGKRRLESAKSRGVIINNKIANVCAPDGIETAEAILQTLASHAGGSKEEYFSSSTGVIGWKLPGSQIKSEIPGLLGKLDDGSILPVAKGIMTTDAYPKIRSVNIGDGSIVAIAKGAGMIEPNMATMLVFLLTDIEMTRNDLQKAIEAAADTSFNRISVDGDQSTSDMVLGFSSNEVGGIDADTFSLALKDLFCQLAQDVVRNGEGTSHVIEVTVEGTDKPEEAVSLGKAIVNSPLVKTAIYGNDPNIGRIVAAVGDFAGNNGISLNPEALIVTIGDEIVFKNGCFELDRAREERLLGYLEETSRNPELKGYPEHDKNVCIRITVGNSDIRETVYGSDLSYEYIRENAEYRT